MIRESLLVYLPRQTMLKRPYIANVDLIVLVFSHCNPDPSDHLITKFLVLAEVNQYSVFNSL